MEETKIKIPDGYKIVGFYGRNEDYVYLKPKGKKNEVAIPFCLTDLTFNIDLPNQLPLKGI